MLLQRRDAGQTTILKPPANLPVKLVAQVHDLQLVLRGERVLGEVACAVRGTRRRQHLQQRVRCVTCCRQSGVSVGFCVSVTVTQPRGAA